MKDINAKTLNRESATLLARLNDEDKKAFVLEDAYRLLPDSDQGAIRKMISLMVKRQLLMRIRDGLYHVIPYDQDADSFMPDWHMLGALLAGDAKYYIGYYSAMQLHSLITQPALIEQIVTNKQIKPAVIKVNDISFQFIYHNDKRFFGSKKIWVDSFNKVTCSDLEKTIIDALSKPEYAGGITEITKAIYKSRDKFDYHKLLDYAIKFDTLAVIKRLGYLLELLEINTPIIDKLQQRKATAYYLLDPSRPEEGKRRAKWHIQENIDKQSILSPLYT